MASDAVTTLLGATLATSTVIVLVLALRIPVRRYLGAAAAHGVWACVPLSCLAMLLPVREVETQWALPLARAMQAAPQVVPAADGSLLFPSAWVILGWSAGALLVAASLAWQQLRFVRGLGPLSEETPGVLIAATNRGLPAALGLVRPRVVVPADFHVRYTDQQRALVLCHERAHIRRGDLFANLLVSALRSLFWFNPLVHYAAHRYRLDQEFACDAVVIAGNPGARRAYAEAMLKAQLTPASLPVGCHWSNHHPLKERIAMLKQPLPTRARRLNAAVLTTALVAMTGYGAWAMQPVSAAADVAQGYHYRIDASLEVDDKLQTFQLSEYPGRPFGFASTTAAGKQWRVQLTIDPQAEDSVRIRGEVSFDGELLSAPVLVAELGREAAMRVTSGGSEPPVALAVRVTRHKGAPGPDAAAPPRQPAPLYPADAAVRHVSGRVMLKLRVGPDGRVREAIVEKSEPQGVFDQASLDAAKRWTFQPAMKDGRPVEGWVRVPIDFESNGRPEGAAPHPVDGPLAARGR